MKKRWIANSAIGVLIVASSATGVSSASAGPVPTLPTWAAMGEPDTYIKDISVDPLGTVYVAGWSAGSKLAEGVVLHAVTRSGLVISDLASTYEVETGATGVVVDAARVVTVCINSGSLSFLRVDRGRTVPGFPSTGFWQGTGCAIDAVGNVYTALPYTHSVVKANSSGITAVNMLAAPAALVVAPDGTRYTYNLDNTISAAGPTAAIGSTFASLPTAAYPWGGSISRDTHGNLYVAHADEGSVQQVNPDGSLGAHFVMSPAAAGHPTHLPIAFSDSGDIYVGFGRSIYRVDLTDMAHLELVANTGAEIVDIEAAGGQLYVAQLDWTIAKLTI